VARFDGLKIRKDRTITADNARPEMIKSLRDAGYKVIACEKFAGSVLSGINDVRKYELCIATNSKNLVKEVHNYQKQQLSTRQWIEEPAKNQVDHGMDAIRYGQEYVNRPQFEIAKLEY
jgi:phage terminase large subunit